MEQRNNDYDNFYIASREETERQIAAAEELLWMAEKYCADKE